jgi:hypothetical protein
VRAGTCVACGGDAIGGGVAGRQASMVQRTSPAARDPPPHPPPPPPHTHTQPTTRRTLTKLMATPLRPKRPLRPMRWMYSSRLLGRS